MPPLSNDATTAFLRALRVTFVTFGGFSLEEIKSHSWASATFTGARHELSLLLEGDDAESRAEAFLEAMEAAEFRLRGHILADIALVSKEKLSGAPKVRLRLEALTVEDG